jgi:hypothetical protein
MADASASADPLEQDVAPERVNYATGVLLGAQDFLDEQTYHRARLARALQYIAGLGTIAGLGVVPPDAADAELTLRVNPGLALDRFGRLIEIQTPQCIRLARWFADQTTSTLRGAAHRAARAGMDVALIADVFLSWHSCDRAKTPAFAAGPFEALDAVVAARLADCFQLKLVPRKESTAPPPAAPAATTVLSPPAATAPTPVVTSPPAPGGGPAPTLPTPANFWPDIAAISDAAARRTQMLQAVIGSWREGGDFRSADGLNPLREHVDGEDTSAVLLARVYIPIALAPDAPSDVRPALRTDIRAVADNGIRPFIFMPGKWMGESFTAASLVLP